MQRCELGGEALDHAAVAGEVVAGEGGEQLERARGGRLLAGALLGNSGSSVICSRVIAWRSWRSIRQQQSSAMKWQQNSASIRSGLLSSTGAASWTDLSWWWRFSRLGW